MTTLRVQINEGFVPMVDGSLVYHRGFGERRTARADPAPSLTLSPHVFTADGRLVPSRSYPLGAALPPHGRPAPAQPDPAHPGEYLVRLRHWASYFPERTLIAESGSVISLRVHNNLIREHQLMFAGVGPGGSHRGTGRIRPGRSALLEFEAPAPGTYIYCDPGTRPDDPSQDPVQRTLGLAGALIVINSAEPWRDAPGGTEFERQWLWILHDVDPQWAQIASRGGAVDPRTTPAYPRYFTLNGRSGFQSLAISADEAANEIRHEESLMSGSARHVDVRDFSQAAATPGTGRAGHLMRFVNTGVVIHQLHFHGNHVWTVGENGAAFPRSGGRVDGEGRVILQHWEDTVEIHPLDRKDSVLPLRRPPDAIDPVWNARTTDWHYPMHCHAEPSQVAAGGMYPGGLVGDWTIAAPTPAAAEHHLYRSQVDFSSDQIHEGSPVTEFKQVPDRSFDLEFFNDTMTFDDGARHRIWAFETPDSGKVLPAPLLRATEGEMVHATFRPSKKVHTIHWHGIEPDPRNDGVGHTSFEITDSYTYQWLPERGAPGDPNLGAAGTYFYHCHVNTPLHVQMGMFGPLVIDPVSHPDFPVTPGVTRRSFVDGPEYDVATETILAAYAVDPRWHGLDHAAGLSGEDVGLDLYEPRHFYLLGGEMARGPQREGPWQLTDIRANFPTAARKPTLLRLVNANYFPVRMSFADAVGTPVAMADLIAHDGRPFRDTSNPRGDSQPITSSSHPLLTSFINFGAAERFDVLLRPPAPGQYRLTVQVIHWITRAVLGTRVVPVIVT